MEGLSLPLTLNNGKFSIFANGLLGLGSQGVPSTRAHSPTLVPVPIMLCKMSEWACTCALASTIDSLILTPGPMVVFGPILTLGPNCEEQKFRVNARVESHLAPVGTIRVIFFSYHRGRMYDGRWMYIHVSYDVAGIVTRGSQAIRLLLLVECQVMSIGIYRGARGLHLRPPSQHGQSEQSTVTRQARQYILLECDVRRISAVTT